MGFFGLVISDGGGFAGAQQSVAEEKFKRCLDAYKSLCDALNSA